MEWMVLGGLNVADACCGGTATHTLRYCMTCGLLGVLASLRETGAGWYVPRSLG
jgi:hypothetical protein